MYKFFLYTGPFDQDSQNASADFVATFYFVKAFSCTIWWMLEWPGLKTGFRKYEYVWQFESRRTCLEHILN